jgi:hypothetical protein
VVYGGLMPFTQEFKELKKNLMENYLGKPVSPQYKKEYGKIYNKKDIEVFAIKVANKLGIKRDKGGEK